MSEVSETRERASRDLMPSGLTAQEEIFLSEHCARY